MKRIFVLILAVLLLLTSVSCARMPADNPAGETTNETTESTDGNTQTQSTQDNDVQDTPQDTQKPVAPGDATPGTSTDTVPQQGQSPGNTTSATLPQGTGGDPGCQHDYQQTATTAATCAAAGSKKFTCSKCGAVTYQQIPMKAHSYQAATCLTPKTCTGCSRTEGAALGHSYDANHLCTRCGVKDTDISPESMPVDFVATIRSDESVPLSGVTVTIYTEASGSNSVGSGVTDQNGRTTIALSAGSRNYTVKLSNVPEGYQAQESYSFTVAQVTINLSPCLSGQTPMTIPRPGTKRAIR